MRFLVTAGSTQEMIDQVRHWRNIFTGNTGFSIAKALAAIGEVDLLTSNQQHIAELQDLKDSGHSISATLFSSHADLREKLSKKMQTSDRYDAVFMSAAVSDYRPAGVFAVVSREKMPDGSGREQWLVQDILAGKFKSTHQTIAVVGQQTEKLVDLFRTEWKFRGLLVKFKLEVGISTDALIEIGQKSRTASQADYLVANTLDMVQGTSAGAYLLSDQGEEWVAREDLPHRLIQLVNESLGDGSR